MLASSLLGSAPGAFLGWLTSLFTAKILIDDAFLRKMARTGSVLAGIVSALIMINFYHQGFSITDNIRTFNPVMVTENINSFRTFATLAAGAFSAFASAGIPILKTIQETWETRRQEKANWPEKKAQLIEDHRKAKGLLSSNRVFEELLKNLELQIEILSALIASLPAIPKNAEMIYLLETLVAQIKLQKTNEANGNLNDLDNLIQKLSTMNSDEDKMADPQINIATELALQIAQELKARREIRKTIAPVINKLAT
ncbi:MAG: hypothetical protein H7A33_05425 [Deltaproteobacteria bacterium]|nr:hypothetical protein [Deltaproteobacteria bacterium]